RLADARPDDDQLLHAVDAPEEFGGGALERRLRRVGIRGFAPGALVGAVAGPLDEPELRNVARDRRLRCVEPVLPQAAAELFLRVKRLAVDQLEEERLSAAFHTRTGG